MNFQEKKRLGLVDDDGNLKKLGNTNTNGPLKRSGAFTKKMGMAAPAQKTLPSAVGSNPGATGNMSNAMGEETVEFLTQQHGLTQKLLEEKFAIKARLVEINTLVLARTNPNNKNKKKELLLN